MLSQCAKVCYLNYVCVRLNGVGFIAPMEGFFCPTMEIPAYGSGKLPTRKSLAHLDVKLPKLKAHSNRDFPPIFP